jgi:hypothetical protein
MTTMAHRTLLAVGLVLLVAGIAGPILPALPGWPLFLLTLPFLVITQFLVHGRGTVQSRPVGRLEALPSRA